MTTRGATRSWKRRYKYWRRPTRRLSRSDHDGTPLQARSRRAPRASEEGQREDEEGRRAPGAAGVADGGEAIVPSGTPSQSLVEAGDPRDLVEVLVEAGDLMGPLGPHRDDAVAIGHG